MRLHSTDGDADEEYFNIVQEQDGSVVPKAGEHESHDGDAAGRTLLLVGPQTSNVPEYLRDVGWSVFPMLPGSLS